MGGKGSGNRLAYKNAKGAKSPVIGDNGLSVKPGEMANIVRGLCYYWNAMGTDRQQRPGAVKQESTGVF